MNARKARNNSIKARGKGLSYNAIKRKLNKIIDKRSKGRYANDNVSIFKSDLDDSISDATFEALMSDLSNKGFDVKREQYSYKVSW
jgi:hypothetical protein